MMIPELGHIFLVIGFALSLLLAVVPLVGLRMQDAQLTQTGPLFATLLFAVTLLSFLCLTYAFLTDDFSVLYVANNSNSQLPYYYKITAVWGGHEGSFLLWLLILSGWTVAFSWLSDHLPADYRARILAVLGWVSIGFYLFITILSSPFERTLPYFPVDGADLNPLLQDPGMIIHPPLLYMGYVGFAVVFAFAMAALMTGRLDASWAKWSRPWTLAAWAFLTLGITIGSWWAYNELGWGGWWFWDPVENASFMPWLVGTALLHSLAVTDQRGAFKAWTVLLAISAFSLSLLGTFLVRSGVIVSVHAFATDPGRGLFILVLLALVIGISLTYFAARADNLRHTTKFHFLSREVALWLNNVFFSAATLIVLLGTLMPLFYKESGLGTISIGEPFFNEMFTYLVVPFAILLGIGPLMRWKKNGISKKTAMLLLVAVASVVLSYAWLLLRGQGIEGLALLGVSLAVWVFALTGFQLFRFFQQTGSLVKIKRSHWAMLVGHFGFAAAVLGISMTMNYSDERDVRMLVGDVVNIQGIDLKLNAVRDLNGPNYSGLVADITAIQGNAKYSILAEKRFYKARGMIMTEAGVHANLARDVYVALGEQLDSGSWVLRIYYKPLIRWIWLGGILIALAGFIAILDPRYRRWKVKSRATVSTVEAEHATP